MDFLVCLYGLLLIEKAIVGAMDSNPYSWKLKEKTLELLPLQPNTMLELKGNLSKTVRRLKMPENFDVKILPISGAYSGPEQEALYQQQLSLKKLLMLQLQILDLVSDDACSYCALGVDDPVPAELELGQLVYTQVAHIFNMLATIEYKRKKLATGWLSNNQYKLPTTGTERAFVDPVKEVKEFLKVKKLANEVRNVSGVKKPFQRDGYGRFQSRSRSQSSGRRQFRNKFYSSNSSRRSFSRSRSRSISKTRGRSNSPKPTGATK